MIEGMCALDDACGSLRILRSKGGRETALEHDWDPEVPREVVTAKKKTPKNVKANARNNECKNNEKKTPGGGEIQSSF